MTMRLSIHMICELMGFHGIHKHPFAIYEPGSMGFDDGISYWNL